MIASPPPTCRLLQERARRWSCLRQSVRDCSAAFPEGAAPGGGGNAEARGWFPAVILQEQLWKKPSRKDGFRSGERPVVTPA